MPKLPLLVHLVFHPESAVARDLARHIHRRLNDDVIVPGLRIPTVFCTPSAVARPAIDARLALAQHSFVIPLADARLQIDRDWCRLVGDFWEGCQGTPHRCAPVQIGPNAWPLDNRLRGVSFARAYQRADGPERDAFVVRRTVIELCRYLLNLGAGDDTTKAPVSLFLSHTKLDLNAEPRVMQALLNYLRADQPVEAWCDSGDIPVGAKFGEEIEQAVHDRSVLVVLTDNYATREWCREEVLLAKEHHRPVAVIDALTKYEVRSFPYLGNTPTIRWTGDPQAAVDLLLKETLRHLHTQSVLEASKRPGDVVFRQPPELTTLVGLPAGTTVLYPDPPVGVGEARRLAKTNVTFTTPLERLAGKRPLGGMRIALSMAESTDLDRFGLDPLHFEAAMLELSRYLLIQGATLAYGGHLGSGGYTQRLLELVRTHNALENVEPFERIVNHRGWPLPRLSVEERAAVDTEMQVVELERPADIDETLGPDFTQRPPRFSGDQSPQHRYAWARGMTDMRAFQADRARSEVVARVVLGGKYGPTVTALEGGARKEQWYQGRIPGVLEEVVLSAQAGQPVFLIGAFGGAARLVIDLLQGIDRPEATWQYQQGAPHAPEMHKLYEARGQAWLDYPDIVRLLREKGIAGINPLLTEAEHRELFDTIDPVRMVELVLTGIGKM
jgi:hypothetical protein